MCSGFRDPRVLPVVFGRELGVGFGPSLQAIRVCERVSRRVGVARLQRARQGPVSPARPAGGGPLGPSKAKRSVSLRRPRHEYVILIVKQ